MTPRARPWLPVAVAVLLFVLSRLLFILSGADLLHPTIDQEAKHTELAWAIASGTFGESGSELTSFMLTSGNVHHPAYLSVAGLYWVLSWALGPMALTIRLVPLLFWTAGLTAIAVLLGRRFGWWVGAMAPLLAIFAPPDLIGLQLSCIGSHIEAAGPMALAIALWLRWLDGERTERSAAVAGLALGYAAAFDYLLWSVALGLVLLAALPPWRKPTGRELGALALGVLVGMWPLWAVLAPDPSGPFRRTMTEDPSSTLLHVATGSGRGLEQWLRAYAWALGAEWQGDGVYGPGGQSVWNDGGRYVVRGLVVLGGLALLPLSALLRDGAQRRAAVALLALPASLLLAIVITSPFDFVRPPYLAPVWFVGVLWPTLGVGMALALWRRGGWRRAPALLAAGWALVGAFGLVAVSAPRMAGLVDLGRAPALLHHRYAAYWHYGLGTVTADEVTRINDLLDVREAEGDPYGAFGLGLGLASGDWGYELGDRGSKELPPPDWPSLRSRLEGYQEFSHNFGGAHPDVWERLDFARLADNMGRALAVRSDGDAALVAPLLVEAQAQGPWPEDFEPGAIWRGFGYGVGRARLLGEPGGEQDLLGVPEPYRALAEEGLEAAIATGGVPGMGRRPVLRTLLGGPT